MTEPIHTTITVAVPSWYGCGGREDDELINLLSQLDGELFGWPEHGGQPLAGEIWQCAGDIHYGINEDTVVPCLEGLSQLEVEFDAHADEYCEWEGERRSWRHGWPDIRRWTATPEECAMTESEFRELRAKHLDQYPIDYLGFVEALDDFWPPPLLHLRDDPPMAEAS